MCSLCYILPSVEPLLLAVILPCGNGKRLKPHPAVAGYHWNLFPVSADQPGTAQPPYPAAATGLKLDGNNSAVCAPRAVNMSGIQALSRTSNNIIIMVIINHKP